MLHVSNAFRFPRFHPLKVYSFIEARVITDSLIQTTKNADELYALFVYEMYGELASVRLSNKFFRLRQRQ